MKLRLVPSILGLAVWLSAAASGQAPAPSRMDDLVERFMALVDRWRPASIEPPGLLREDLLRLNPGRDREVAQIASAERECFDRIGASMPRAARNAARALGEERLARLVELLEGPEGAAVERATSREDAGPLSDAEREARQRLNAREPMNDYRRWMYSLPRYMDEADMSSTASCYERLFATAARLGLRTE